MRNRSIFLYICLLGAALQACGDSPEHNHGRGEKQALEKGAPPLRHDEAQNILPGRQPAGEPTRRAPGRAKGGDKKAAAAAKERDGTPPSHRDASTSRDAALAEEKGGPGPAGQGGDAPQSGEGIGSGTVPADGTGSAGSDGDNSRLEGAGEDGDDGDGDDGDGDGDGDGNEGGGGNGGVGDGRGSSSGSGSLSGGGGDSRVRRGAPLPSGSRESGTVGTSPRTAASRSADRAAVNAVFRHLLLRQGEGPEEVEDVVGIDRVVRVKSGPKLEVREAIAATYGGRRLTLAPGTKVSVKWRGREIVTRTGRTEDAPRQASVIVSFRVVGEARDRPRQQTSFWVDVDAPLSELLVDDLEVADETALPADVWRHRLRASGV